MSLSEKIEAGRQASIAAQRQRDAERERQRQEERQSLESARREYDSYLKEQERLESEIRELERLEASEQQRITLEEQKRQNLEQGKKQIEQKYQSQIQALKAERAAYADPKLNKNISQSTIRAINSKIQNLEGQYSKELQLYEYSAQNPGKQIPTSVLKNFEGGTGRDSLARLIEEKEISAEVTRQKNIMASQQTARSEAVKAREELEELKREFSSKRQAADSQQGADSMIFKEYSLETKIKKVPGRRLSKPFEGLPDIDAESIYGTTSEKSDKAVYTFEQTQQQQKELERQIRGAKSAAETKEIETKFQTDNPYVGTPNIYQYKGKTLDTQGITIEKELNIAIPEFDKILESEAKPEPKITQTKDTKVELTENLSLDAGLGEGSYVERGVPGVSVKEEYVWEDERGIDVKTPTNEQLFSKAMEYVELSKVSFKPSKTDLELAKYEGENFEELAKFELTEQARESGKAKVIIDPKKDSLESGYFGAVSEYSELVKTELILKSPEAYKTLGYSDRSAAKELKQLQESPVQKSIESTVFLEVQNDLRSSLGMEEKKEPETLKLIEEKSKTPEGQAWLAGSLIFTGATLYGAAIAKMPGFAKREAAKTKAEAEAIARSLSEKKPDAEFVKIREGEIAKDLQTQFPKMPEAEARIIARERLQTPDEAAIEKWIKEKMPSKSQTEIKNIIEKTRPKPEPSPYTIDLLDPKSALITVGTESTEAKIILYERSANRAFVFKTEKPDVVRSILLRGRQVDKAEIAKDLQKRFPAIPKEELEKAVSALSKDLERGKVVVTAKEARLAQKKTPLIKETKETISLSDKKRARVVTGTDAINYDKSDLGKYKATKANLKRLEDDTEYAFLGSMKIVRADTLLKFPSTVMASIEKEQPFAATAIYERATRQKPQKPKPDERKKPFSTDKINLTTSYGKTKFSTDKIDLNTSYGKAKLETPTKPKPSAQSINKLKNMAKNISKSAKSDTGLESSFSRAKAGLTTKTESKTQQPQSQRESYSASSLQGTMGSTRLKLDGEQIFKLREITGGKLIQEPKMDDLVRIAEKINLKITDEQSLAGLYSLITSRGLKQEQLEQLRFKISTRQKQITKLDTPTPTRTKPPTTPPRTPKPVGVTVFSKKQKKELSTASRPKKSFYAWNVNELSPGYYLPTKELSVGRTRKVIRRVEKIQAREARRKVKIQFESEEPTRTRRTKREKPFFRKSFSEITERKNRKKFYLK